MTAIQQMKQGNAIGILRLLREAPLSRAELARRMGLTRAAVTGIADRLIAEGLVREGEAAKIAKGRRPTLLELVPEAFYAVGIDVSREGTTLCFLDFSMHPVEEYTWGAELAREQMLHKLTKCIRQASQKYRLLGVGVVAPGPVDCTAGRIALGTGAGAGATSTFFSTGGVSKYTFPPVVSSSGGASAIGGSISAISTSAIFCSCCWGSKTTAGAPAITPCSNLATRASNASIS